MLPKFLQLLASSQSNFFISARARKKIAVLGMLANARKDHSSPLVFNCVFLFVSLLSDMLANKSNICFQPCVFDTKRIGWTKNITIVLRI